MSTFLHDAPPAEVPQDAQPAKPPGSWRWFWGGFLLVFVFLLFGWTRLSLHPSGQYAFQCSLWQYYASSSGTPSSGHRPSDRGQVPRLPRYSSQPSTWPSASPAGWSAWGSGGSFVPASRRRVGREAPGVGDVPMTRDLGASRIRSHVPPGHSLPERFDAFLLAGPPFPVEWNDLSPYGLEPSAHEQAVPFLRLPDGGLVAFWFLAASPAVVHIGAHGELQALAGDFDAFLRAVAGRCSGLADFDEADEPFRVPGVEGPPDIGGLADLQACLGAWFKANTSLREPTRGPLAETLRQRVMAVAEQLLGDGGSKVYALGSSWWSVTFRIERRGTGLAISYLDYGEWHPLDEGYGMAEVARDLLPLTRDPDRAVYELSACRAGIVSVDRDRELVLVPPPDA